MSPTTHFPMSHRSKIHRTLIYASFYASYAFYAYEYEHQSFQQQVWLLLQLGLSLVDSNLVAVLLGKHRLVEELHEEGQQVNKMVFVEGMLRGDKRQEGMLEVARWVDKHQVDKPRGVDKLVVPLVGMLLVDMHLVDRPQEDKLGVQLEGMLQVDKLVVDRLLEAQLEASEQQKEVEESHMEAS